MSLVNDALKQAQQTRPKLAPQADGPAMRPVEAARRPGERRNLMLPALIAVALSVGGASLWEWVDSGQAAIKVRANSNLDSQVTVHPAAEPEVVQPAPVPASGPKSTPVLSSALPEKSNDLPPAAESASNAVAAVAVEQPKAAPAVYKLQGIFYLPKDPSAVINGKAVFVGSRVGDATVLAITKDSATIVTSSGQTNVLELGDKVR